MTQLIDRIAQGEDQKTEFKERVITGSFRNLAGHSKIKANDYAAMENISRATANKDLLALTGQGRITRIGKTRGAYYILPSR